MALVTYEETRQTAYQIREMIFLNGRVRLVGRWLRPLRRAFHADTCNRSKVLISTDEVFSRVADDDTLYIFDASWHMPAANRNGHEEYLQTHLPGKTFFFDIDSIVDTNSALPHTFPPITKFQEYVREVQLPSDSEVVVYDSNGMFSAARCWYIFKYFGHTNVRMLDGGLPKWIAENKPTVSGNQLPMDTGASKGTLFEATPSGNSVVSLTEMDPDNVDCDFAILDARSSERFFGKVPEPRPGLRSGHIPGSSNLPFTNLLCEDENAMLFKENEELLESFRSLTSVDINDTSKTIVATCGSGVSACVLIAALEILGRSTNIKLFDDSWTGYGSSDYAISTKNLILEQLFANADIRVGEILEAIPVANSDKLYRETIDVGESSPRQIVSGLAPYYTAQELLGRKVLVLCNLKKAKLAGVDSYGMILCAEDSQRNVVELIEPSPGSEILNGARVTLLDSEEEKNGKPASANQMKKKKIFDQICKHLRTNEECVAAFDGVELAVEDVIFKANSVKYGLVR